MATFTLTPHGDVVLCLTPAEAQGLRTLATEGASALLNDMDVARTAFKTSASIDAARRSLDAIRSASGSPN